MDEQQPAEPVPAKQVAQLRRLTGLPWMDGKRLLASLTSAERTRLIEAAEAAGPGGIARDPIEDDPAVRPLFLAVCAQADREVQEWHRQRIAELEQQSPAVAALFRNGRGLCHRQWALIKKLLHEQHGIEWQSPAEMNPWVIYD
jgi:hypothetical protein